MSWLACHLGAAMEKSHNLQKILIKYCNHCLQFTQMLFEKCFVQSLLLAEILTSTLFCSSQLFNQSAFDLYSHQKGTWQTSGWHLPTTISYTVWLGYTLQAFWCFCVVKFPQSQRSAQTETYLIMLFLLQAKVSHFTQTFIHLFWAFEHLSSVTYTLKL